MIAARTREGGLASGCLLQARALAARGPRGTRPAVAWLQRPAHPGTRAAYARVREAPCGGAQRHEESRATPTLIRRSAARPSVAGGRRLGPGLRMTEGARHAAAADVHAQHATLAARRRRTDQRAGIRRPASRASCGGCSESEEEKE